MTKQTSLDHENSQLELSYELLYLLKWFIDHESDTLKQMVTRAVRNGRIPTIKPGQNAVELDESIQYSILDFLDLIDIFLHEASREQTREKALQRNLLPAIDHIDTTMLDQETVQNSIDSTTQKLEHHPHQNPKEILFKELLKHWRPRKKAFVN